MTQFLLCGLGALVATSHLVQATTSTTSTNAKAGAVATFTVASASDYDPTGTAAPAAVASPTGDSILIQQEDDGDVYVYLSDKKQDALALAYKSSCGGAGKDAACEEALAKVLNDDSVDISSRNPILLGAALIAVVAMAWKHLEDSDNNIAPVLIHFNPDDYAPISTLQIQKPTQMIVHDGTDLYTVSVPVDIAHPVTLKATQTTTSTKKCPSTTNICQEADCGGAVTIKTCNIGTKSGCDCLNKMTRGPGQYYDTSTGAQQATLLSSIWSGVLASGTSLDSKTSSASSSSSSAMPTSSVSGLSCYNTASYKTFATGAASSAVATACSSLGGKSWPTGTSDSAYAAGIDPLKINADGTTYDFDVQINPPLPYNGQKIDADECKRSLLSAVNNCPGSGGKQMVGDFKAYMINLDQ